MFKLGQPQMPSAELNTFNGRSVALVFNLLRTGRPFESSGNPLSKRKEGRGKPCSLCRGELYSYLILWNKAFELRKLNLAVSFEPVKCHVLKLRCPFLVVLCSHPTWNWTLHCPWWGGERKEQWHFPGNRRKCSCLIGSCLTLPAYPLLVLNSGDNWPVTTCNRNH